MAAARAEKTKAVIHIHSLQDDSDWNRKVSSMTAQQRKSLRLVTISCSDANGLLERITKLLSSGGSRVLDADVMLSSDGIALDRFVVEMTGRLRLDKLATGIESFLKRAFELQVEPERSTTSSESSPEISGSIYFKETVSPAVMSSQAIQEDLLTAIPLVDVLESSGHSPRFPLLRKTHSMPPQLNASFGHSFHLEMKQEANYSIRSESDFPASEIDVQQEPVLDDPQPQSNRQRRPLVNRSATYDLDTPIGQGETKPVDYLTVPGSVPDDDGTATDSRRVPLIPFEELMLIETIGTGRVSTIYRAVWQRLRSTSEGLSNARMVALKVAMVHNGDTSHVDELRREADIAARLSHPNVCDLKGVAADPDCFCLAYEYCEGGSLHSLLADPSRYYEYLPIALDISNGMAYLHSRNIIHRDLKTSNILLTRDHRAKICDFGMSIMNMGQELTAETGTYRYMVCCR
jgi:predicted amino acid-binding ACT domain protein